MKKHTATKLGIGRYEYLGITVTKDEYAPQPWFIIFKERKESFAKRSEAQNQIDRLLTTASGIARAISNQHLAKLDLANYCTPANVLQIKRQMYTDGRLITRDTILAQARLGAVSPIKRMLVAIIAAGHYDE